MSAFRSILVDDPELGEALARRFVPVRVLGQGAQGIVYLVEQPDLARQVVLKLVALDGPPGEQRRERFQREASLLARLKSPHVVGLIEHGAGRNHGYLVSPFAGGKSLHGVLREQMTLTPERTRTWFREALEGLAEAHELGVIHRDVKPANLLIDDRDCLRILDFGLARSLEVGTSLTGTGMVAGTPSYLSPERIQGRAATPADDLYALAIVAHEMGTGSNPFMGRDLAETLARHSRLTPEPLDRLVPGFDPGLSRLVVRMLAKAERSRPRDAGEALLDLDAAPGPGGADPTSGDAATLEVSRLDSAELRRGSGPSGTPRPGLAPTGGRAAVGAGSAAVSGGPGRIVAGCVATGLALALGFGLTGPASPPAIEPPPSPPSLPVTVVRPRGPAYPEEASPEALRRSGEEARGEYKKLDVDPVVWTRLLQYPPQAAFLDWLLAGGRLEDLDPVRREELRILAREETELERVSLLELVDFDPDPAQESELRWEVLRVEGSPFRVAGPMAALIRGHQRIERLLEQLERETREMAEDGTAPDDGLGSVLAVSRLASGGRSYEKYPYLDKAMSALRPMPSHVRLAMTRHLREVDREAGRVLVEWLRRLRDPSTAERSAAYFAQVFQPASVAYFPWLLRLPPERADPAGSLGPSVDYVLGFLAGSRLWMCGGSWVEEGVHEIRRLDRSLLAPARSPLGWFTWRMALWARFTGRTRAEEVASLASLMEHLVPMLSGVPAEIAEFAAWSMWSALVQKSGEVPPRLEPFFTGPLKPYLERARERMLRSGNDRIPATTSP